MNLVGWHLMLGYRRSETHRVFVSVNSITSRDKPEVQRKVIACRKLGLYIPAVEVIDIKPVYAAPAPEKQLQLW